MTLMINTEIRNHLFLKYHRIIDLLLPVGSRRRFLLVTLVNSLLHTNPKGGLQIITSFMRSLRGLPSEPSMASRCVHLNKAIMYSLESLSFFDFNVAQIDTFALACPVNPRVSIVIPTFNKWMYTYRCLAFLSALTDSVPFEVIVIDNGSTDDTEKLLKKIQGLRIMRNETNIGFVEACNMGSSASRGEFILFLNNDAFVMPECLNEMVNLMEHDHQIGIVGAKLLFPDGRLQEAGGIVWNDPHRIAWNYGKYDNPWKYEYNYVREVDYCSGACLLVRTEAFLKSGMFDEEFAPAYFEDTSLAFSMRKIGYKVVYQPSAVAIHLEGITAGRDVKKGLKQHQVVNQSKFYNTWKYILSSEHFRTGENVFVAKDRSRFKKTILYIDHEIPTFDKDAGSMITFQYLSLFIKMGFKIIFWPANLKNVEPYTTTLQQMGIEVIYGYANFNDYIKKYGRYIDVAFVSRALTAISFLEKIKSNSQAKIIYVPHDLHFLREFRRAELENNTKLEKYARKLQRLEFSLSRKSDITLVFSDFEKKVLQDTDPT